MKAVDYFADLPEKLKAAGIKKGDMVYVASDIRKLLYQIVNECGAQTKDRQAEYLGRLTDLLQDAVGADGTLLFPVFSWDFCRGKGFDYYKTQGEVGSYSNWILNNRGDFRRTRHPIYSFMVWGRESGRFCQMNNQDAWGVASPFYFFLNHGGKELEFNVESYKALTFVHCFEQMVKVPYRHPKYFFGNYTDENGNTEIRCYSMYVRDLGVTEHTKATHKYLIDHGVATEENWNENKLTLIDIKKCCRLVSRDITENDGRKTLEFKDYNFKYGTKQTVSYEISDIPVN